MSMKIRNSYLIGLFAVLLVIVGLIFVTFNERPVEQTASLPKKITDLKTQKSADNLEDCSGVPTTFSSQGPYYKPNTPERTNVAPELNGERLVVEGYVFNIDCNPIVGAWLDFWQADENGEYDNIGYNLRGHQFTENSGRYYLETVLPAQYGPRPPHIHVKVRANDTSPVLTTQLYLPGEKRNQSDSIFNESLIVSLSEDDGKKISSFNFVLDVD